MMQISDKELKKQILDEVSKLLREQGVPLSPAWKKRNIRRKKAVKVGPFGRKPATTPEPTDPDAAKDPSPEEKTAAETAEIEKLAAEDPEKAFNEYKSANSTVQAIIFPFLLRPNVIPLIVLTKQIESASKNPAVKTFLRAMSGVLEEHFKKAIDLSYDEKFQAAGTKIPPAPGEPEYTKYGIEEKKTK